MEQEIKQDSIKIDNNIRTIRLANKVGQTDLVRGVSSV